MTFDLYAEVTQQIISILEKGVVPWRSPILKPSAEGLPQNIETKKPYRGVNVFMLAFTAWNKGYESSYWLTFNQARAHGGTVKKGEKASMVVFWKQLDTIEEGTGANKRVPMLRYYNVFNVEQCEGIPTPGSKVDQVSRPEFRPMEAAETLVKGYADGPAIERGGSEASYHPAADTVRIPEPSRFWSGDEYYATLLHELAHSTGHSSRLDRKFESQPAPFGSPDYAREELVAEMAGAFLSSYVGIQPAVIENQAAYIQGWLKRLKEDKRLVISASGAAQKAADWIRGQRTPAA